MHVLRVSSADVSHAAALVVSEDARAQSVYARHGYALDEHYLHYDKPLS